MGFSTQLTFSLGSYLMSNSLKGRKSFPLVLMLEPSFRCNLACNGCGRIREFKDILNEQLTAEQCLASVEEAGAPVVSITGGEPLLHPDIDKIVAGIIAKKRFVNLCTNGLLLEQSLSKFKPGPHMNFVLHMDGLAAAHDKYAGRQGVFDTAIEGMKAAKKQGFSILINTTIYKGTNLDDIEQLFEILAGIPVNGLMISPAFSYEAVDGDFFLPRQEIVKIFSRIHEMAKNQPLYNTPIYWEYLTGKRQLPCAPWSTPTRNPKGWKQPCYLITDGHCQSYSELMTGTDWSKYGPGNDLRCANCMVHCGFEGSALQVTGRSPAAALRMTRWYITGK